MRRQIAIQSRDQIIKTFANYPIVRRVKKIGEILESMRDGFIHSVIEVCIVATLVVRTQIAKEHQTVEHAVKRASCQSSTSPGTTHSRERSGNS